MTTSKAVPVSSGYREHPPVTLEEQIACIDRELGMRRKLYPRWVASGKLTQANADLELRRLEAVMITLEECRRHPVRASMHAVGEAVDIPANPALTALRHAEMERCLRVMLDHMHTDRYLRVERKIRQGFDAP